MIKGYSKGRYEFFVVLIAISIVVLFAFDRYQGLANSARDLGFEIISHHFMKGAADARVQWLLQPGSATAPNKNNFSLAIGNQKIYFSPQAWPASINPIVGEHFKPTVADCYGLWMALLQNPAPISQEGKDDFGSRQYHVSVKENACRYLYLHDGDVEEYYFDYFPLDGWLVLSVPNHKRFEN